MRRTDIILAAFVLGGCHSIDNADPPPLEGVRSAVLVAFEGADTHVIGVDEQEDGTVSLPTIVQHDDIDLWAMTYSCPIDRIGLGPGDISLATTPIDGASLPAPRATYRTRLVPGDDVAWSATDPSMALRDIIERLPVVDGLCASSAAFSAREPIELPSDQSDFFAFGVVPDETRAYLASAGGVVYEVTRDKISRRLETMFTTPPVASHVDATGKTWVVDRAGELFSGDFLTGFTSASATATTTSILAKLVGPSKDAPDAPFELFFATDDRQFLRYDGRSWTTLATNSGERAPIFVAAAVWIGPGEAVSVGMAGPNNVVRYRDGIVTQEPVETQGTLASLDLHPTLGLLAGTDIGEVFRNDGTGWQKLTQQNGWMLLMRPFGEGVWLGAITSLFGARSTVGFWGPAHPDCGREDVRGLIRDVLSFDDERHLIVTQMGLRSSFSVDFVTLERSFIDCARP